MKRKLVIALLALLFAFPAIAQDVTDEPILPTVSPVVEVTEAAPVETPAPPVETPSTGLLDALGGYLLAALAGAGIGAAGVSLFATRLRNDKAALDAIEWLGKSVPIEALVEIRKIGAAFRDVGEVIDIVTDQKPNTSDIGVG